MEGPTPVSALIHAATMVVAGVYLVARAMPLFEASEAYVLNFVIVIGLITTFMSVGMGMVMTDIKRVVAYSTLNSLGLMMVALGFGEHGVGAAMLYLFCPRLLQGTALPRLWLRDPRHGQPGGLEAWRVGRQAADYQQDLPDRLDGHGGCCAAGRLLAKDEILVAAKDASPVTLILLLLTLPFTAMYMARLYMLTFTGEPKDQHVHEHAHESGPVMSVPLILLAILAVLAGFVVFDPIGEAARLRRQLRDDGR